MNEFDINNDMPCVSTQRRWEELLNDEWERDKIRYQKEKDEPEAHAENRERNSKARKAAIKKAAKNAASKGGTAFMDASRRYGWGNFLWIIPAVGVAFYFWPWK